MKNPKLLSMLLVFLLSTISFTHVGIGTLTPNADAILELDATDKGLRTDNLLRIVH